MNASQSKLSLGFLWLLGALITAMVAFVALTQVWYSQEGTPKVSGAATQSASEAKREGVGTPPSPQNQTGQAGLSAKSAVSSPLAEIPGKTYPIQNLASEFVSLSDKAEHGDLRAARTLVQALQTCSGVPKTFEELDRAEANANRPNLAPNWADLSRRDLDYKKSLFNQCVGTTKEEVATYKKWVGLMAEAGDAEARLQYVAAARPTDYQLIDYDQQLANYKEKAGGYIQSEIDAGNPQGLATMALQYESFIMKSQSSNEVVSEVVPLYAPDPVKAYAYYYAYALASGDKDSDAVTFLASLQGRLTSAQLQSATATGTQIYDRCCKARQ